MADKPDTDMRDFESELHALGRALWIANRLLDDLNPRQPHPEAQGAIAFIIDHAERVHRDIMDRAGLSI